MTSADYLNQTVWATIKPSKIHGVGVFAIRHIPKGMLITTNRIFDLQNQKKVFEMNEDEFNSILPEIREVILDRILFSKKSFTFFSPNDEICLQSFMNHSDNPNTDDSIALRDIAKGEEITESYKQLDGFDNIHPYSREYNKSIFK